MSNADTLRVRARSAEIRNLSRELIGDCRQSIERARRLLEDLERIRAEVRENLLDKPHGPFAWLAAKDFDALSPARKRAYLDELSDHLENERAASTHRSARPRPNVFLGAGEYRD